MSFEMSARDKKLLVYLVSAVILAAAYFFGVSPFLEKKDALDSEISTLQSEVNKLTDIYNNQDDYAVRIDEGRAKVTEALAKFPGGITQENTLMMLQNIEDKTSTWISRVSFQEVQLISGVSDSGEGDMADETGENADESESNGEDEENEGEDSDSISNISVANLKTMRQDLSLDYSCSYSDFKNFIKYIQDYDSRLFISDLSASYSPELNEVSGAVTLSQYAIEGAGKKLEKPDLTGVALGVDNIFTTLQGTTDNTLEIGTLTQEGSEDDESGETGESEEPEEEAGDEEDEDNGRR